MPDRRRFDPCLLDPRLLAEALASVLAPARCRGCGEDLAPAPGGPGGPWRLCRACAARLRPIRAGCSRCGRERGQGATPRVGCPACAGKRRGAVRTTTALLAYRGLGRGLLHQLKYRGEEPLGLPLGRALGERLARVQPAVCGAPELLVVPVPLHWRRAWGRGFDQARELAWGVAEALERPLWTGLRRARATPALFRLPAAERARAVRGAFHVVQAAALAGRPVLLVDDIRTTGATLREAAAALRRAGARRVDAAVVAA